MGEPPSAWEQVLRFEQSDQETRVSYGIFCSTRADLS